MKIIIVGAGKVGYSVAETLSSEGHDITVIDKNPDAITTLSNNLDVICVEGSATNPETLREAGAEDADMLLAATRSDETNMVCGISASKLGTKHVIARIRDTAYLKQTEFLQEVLGLSVIINPEYECAKEISRMLRFPGAIRVDAFSKGSAEMMEHRVAPGSRLVGVELKNLHKDFNAKVLVSVVKRGDEALIPNGDFKIAAGQYKKPVRSVMIMGGGRIAVYLARMLMETGIAVTVIEADRSRCDELCDLIPDARIIFGDATRSDILDEEGISSTDAFVALTGDDGDNIITSMHAKHRAVGKIIVKVNRQYYTEILESSGLESIVTPRSLVAGHIARYVRAMSNSVGSSMETMYRLADGRVEALEFKVKEGSSCVGVPLKTLRLKPNVLISAVIRGSKLILPDGETVIRPGDHAVVIARAGWLKNLDEIVDNT